MIRIAVGAILLSAGLVFGVPAIAQDKPAPAAAFNPKPYLEGKDVPWVPTPEALVEKMLDMAELTSNDVVVDLGSGDGRTVIAAAKRGVKARGVEYNADLVELSKRRAAEAGVGDAAMFVEGDMYKADISDATVLPLFLLTENLDKLLPDLLKLRPGTRILNNSFEFTRWDYDAISRIGGDTCERYCTAYLYIVPAQVEGVWRLEDGELDLRQEIQWLTGTLTVAGQRKTIERGRVQGDVIRFMVDKTRYTGRLVGNTISGQLAGDGVGPWRAQR